MKLSKTFHRAAVGTMLGTAAIGVSAEALAAFQAHISVKGAKQGQFKGEGIQDKRKDKWMPVVSFSFGVVSPRDPQSGLPTGKRKFDSLCFTKESGGASPQFFIAGTTNEALPEVNFEFSKMTPQGQESVFQTIKLTNATVSSVKQFIARPDQGPTAVHNAVTADMIPLDEVCFTFQKIEIKNTESKETFSDSWGGVTQ